jgi:hypothetical protein
MVLKCTWRKILRILKREIKRDEKERKVSIPLQ